MAGSPFDQNSFIPIDTLSPWFGAGPNKPNSLTLDMNHGVPLRQHDTTLQSMSHPRNSPITPTQEDQDQAVQPPSLQSTFHFPSQYISQRNISPNYQQPNISYQPPTTYGNTVGQIPTSYMPILDQYGSQTFNQQFFQGATAMPIPQLPISPVHNGHPTQRPPLNDKTNRIQGPGRITKPSSSHKSSNFRKVDVEKLVQLLMRHGQRSNDGGVFIDSNTLEKLTAMARSPTQPMSRTSTATEYMGQDNPTVIDDDGFGSALPTANRQQQQQSIASEFRGWRKEFRYSGTATATKQQFQCTLGCDWSHAKKSNWERHEKTHYPPEIWICFQEDCLDKPNKHRVSGRKDLARRHYVDYHLKNGLPPITHMQLEEMKVTVKDSRFPRECVFQGCDAKFETFDDRSRHTEQHLRSNDILCRDRIPRNFVDRTIKEESDDDAQYEVDEEPQQRPSTGHQEVEDDIDDAADDKDDHNDNEDDDDEEDDDNNPNDGRGGFKRHDNNPDGGTGAGGTGSSNWMQAASGTSGWVNTPMSSQQMQHHQNHGNQSYGMAFNFDTFGGNGYIPQTDKRPWKALSSLRLQLLPQVFARGISQTPLVLKKIQLQAAMALEMTGVSKIQITKILRREIAMMVKAMPRSRQSAITGLPQSKTITRLQSGLEDTVSSSDTSSLALQDQAIARFADLDADTISEKDPDLLERASDFDLAQVLAVRGGHIYRCLPVISTMKPIRPTRLIHVGSWSTPKLHLDTSDVLPKKVAFCSVSHCWDDGHGLFLSRSNAASLRENIPADGLTQTFHLAVNIARDKGVEYLWIDTLCIMQDSDEDIRAEAPRITQIHASATFAIVITSVAYGQDAGKPPSTALEDTSSGKRAISTASLPDTMSDVPDLTIDNSIDSFSLRTPPDIGKDQGRVAENQRRDSHQLESFLAEPQKKSFFLPFLPLSRERKTPSPPGTPQNFKRFLPWSNSDMVTNVAEPKQHVTTTLGYLDKWHNRWQKMASRSQTQSPIASREPSISDISLRSEKHKAILSALPNAVEKLFQNLRKKDVLQIELGEPDG